MKIAVFVPREEFSVKQQKRLSKLGEVVFTNSRKAPPVTELLKLSKGSEIIAPDPDVFGGFEKAKPVLTQIMETLPNLKGVCLATTSFGWIDLEYCKKRNLSVSNIPGYSGESVAEHSLAILLCLAKRILISDRKTQRGEYEIKKGFELRGKTLGIIGLGDIGGKLARLALGIGMKVVACNRSPKRVEGVEMKSLEAVLKESDAISLHVTHENSNKGIIGTKEISRLKESVIIVNTVDPELIDEQALAEAIKTGKVYGYAYEGEDLENSPLSGLENAIGLKGFGWFTTEALENLYKIWVENIVALAKGRPTNIVSS